MFYWFLFCNETGPYDTISGSGQGVSIIKREATSDNKIGSIPVHHDKLARGTSSTARPFLQKERSKKKVVYSHNYGDLPSPAKSKRRSLEFEDSAYPPFHKRSTESIAKNVEGISSAQSNGSSRVAPLLDITNNPFETKDGEFPPAPCITYFLKAKDGCRVQKNPTLFLWGPSSICIL